MNPIDLFHAGDLHGAASAVTEQLKRKPTDVSMRLFLAELLCFSGDLDRAEKQLDTISLQSTEGAITIALYRQLIRGEVVREQVIRQGRTPEVVVPLSPDATLMLEALLAQRLGQHEEAARLQQQAEAQRPAVSGQCNGTPFTSFRDLDDRFAGVLEVISSHGKYYWIPWQSIESLEMEAPKVPMDLAYRLAEINVRGGPQGQVYIPTRYLADKADEEQSPALLLGRATEWVGEEGQFVQGRGLRTFLADDRDLTIMEIETLSFTEANS